MASPFRCPWRVLCLCLISSILVKRGATSDGGFDPRYENPLEAIPVSTMTVELDNTISLNFTPPVLTSSGEWVTVSWSGVWLPTSYDWIAVYLGADTDPTKTAPVKYKTAASDTFHLITGSGKVRFRLLNMRDAYKFAFVRKWGHSPSVAAVTAPLLIDDVNEPTQVHLALTGKEGQMRVTWVTRDVGKAPHVRWGLASDTLTSRAKGISTTYRRDEMCGGPAANEGWLSPGVMNTAVLLGLQPGAIVFYQVGDDHLGYSRIFSFYPLPKVGPTASVNMIAFGDMGQAELDGSNDMTDSQQASLATIRRMLMDPFVTDDTQLQTQGLVVLHVGDISYARGYACQWDVFFDQIQLIAARVPWMTCIGNHERDWPGSGSYLAGTVTDSGGECGIPYERRLPMPPPAFNFPPIKPTQRQQRQQQQQWPSLSWRNVVGLGAASAGSGEPRRLRAGPAAGDSPWYSFDHGPAHFVMMDTEHEFGESSPQYQFLAEDLASVNRSRTPWLIFCGHRPMYVDSTYDAIPDGDLPVATHLRLWIEPLLVKHRVDLAMWGHHHSYQRTCPVIREQCVKPNKDGTNNAPVHLVVGMAGFGLCTNIKPVKPDWIEAVNVVTHGYVRLSISPQRLQTEFIGNNDGAVLDSSSLVKGGGSTRREERNTQISEAVW